jgi:hypothetical protein
VTRRLRRILAIAIPLAVGLAVAAFAAGPIKGKTYTGKTLSYGTGPEGQFEFVEGKAFPLTLKVSASGKSVTASFPGVLEGSSRRALFYCNVGVAMKSQVTKPAKISKGGSFTATIRDKLAEEPGVPLKQVISGTFSGGKVSGTVRTETSPGCSGSTTFSAKAG